MGHDDNQRAVGRIREFVRRLGSVDQRDIRRRVGRKSLATRVDPADHERQQRARAPARPPAPHGARRTHRPRERSPRAAPSSLRTLAGSRSIRPPRLSSSTIRSTRPSLRVLALREVRPSLSASTIGDRSARSRQSNVSMRHSTRPPQRCANSGPRATDRRSAGPRPCFRAACAASSATHSSAPPPIVPWKPPEGLTTMCAPASRGLDPSTRRRRTFGFDRVDEPPEGEHHASSIGPVQ